MLRRLPLVAMAATAFTIAGLAACNDTNTLRATAYVAPDTLVAYSLGDTPPSYPSGLSTVGRTVVRVDGTASFDVAFNINNVGAVDVIPARIIVSSLVGVPSVGLQKLTVPFDSVTRAPAGYYRPDTAITVTPGETFVILANRNGGTAICYALATPQIYAKVVIDSVNTLAHTIHLRQVVNPNCGYRSFLTGLPAN